MPSLFPPGWRYSRKEEGCVSQRCTEEGKGVNDGVEILGKSVGA